MDEGAVTYSVFTKPWRVPIRELAEHVSRLGFQGIELPVRPGYPVAPENVSDLYSAAQELDQYGIAIFSIAGPTDEPTMAACAEAGVGIIRICVGIRPEGYMATEAALLREWEAMVPLLDNYGVTLGIQNHCGNSIASAASMLRLLERFSPRHIAAVWDPAHSALDGEPLDQCIDMLWPHLCMVNLKNAIWQRTNGPEALYAEWRTYWTSGRHGLASWPEVASLLKARGYSGVVCLTAEYSDHSAVDRLIAEDFAFARSLLG